MIYKLYTNVQNVYVAEINDTQMEVTVRYCNMKI